MDFRLLAKSGQRSHVATVFDYRTATILLPPMHGRCGRADKDDRRWLSGLLDIIPTKYRPRLILLNLCALVKHEWSVSFSRYTLLMLSTYQDRVIEWVDFCFLLLTAISIYDQECKILSLRESSINTCKISIYKIEFPPSVPPSSCEWSRHYFRASKNLHLF